MPKREKRAAPKDMVLPESGRSGTPEYSGYISADYNLEFNGRAGVELCDKMRKTDGTVAAALRAVKYPLMAAEWTVESADRKDDRAKEIAEFVRANLFDRMSFPEFLREALGYLDFGFWYFEKVYRVEDGWVVVDRLASRLPTAHECWKMRTTHAPGVTQTLPSRKHGDPGPTQPEIPMGRLVLFTNEREGDNLAGTPLLRPAYKHYFMKDQLYRIDAVKHERGAGILKLRHPSDDAAKAAADEIGENFVLNEKGYLAFPGPKPEQGTPGWDAEIMTAGIAEQSAALMESVKHHDRMITQSILAMFLDLGSGAGGSYALGDAQKGFFGFALKAVSEYFASVVDRQLIVELVDMNFGKQEAYPKLRAPRIGQMDQKTMAEVLAILNTTGLLTKDPELKVWVSRAFGLPERTVEDFEEEDGEDGADEDTTVDGLPPEGGDPAADQPGGTPDAGKGGNQLSETRWRRPLTFAEKRVKLAEAKKAMRDDRDAAKAVLDAMTDRQKAALLEKAAKVISEDDIAAAIGLTLASDRDAEAALQEIARKALERGKLTASDEIGAAAPVTSAYAKRAVKAKVALYLADRASSISSAARKRLVDIMNGDVGKAAGLFELEQVIAAAASKAAGPLIGQVSLEPLHEGRWLAFDDAKEQIHAMQRSEILDDRSCNVCLSLDGRILAQSDPMTQVGEVHDNCDGQWVAILKTDADLPEPKPLPKSVASHFDLVGGVPTINEVSPMAKPIYTKDSRVARKVKDGELEIL